MRFFLFFAVACLYSSLSYSKDEYYSDSERGWYWYEETPEPIPSPVEEVSDVKVDSKTPSAPLSPREILKQQGEKWEDALANAILNPSNENYREYIKQTALINKQSEDFAVGFKETIWVTPEYDYTLEKPRTTQAIFAQSEINNEDRDTTLNKLSDENGFIFFFRSDCKFCHRFAPILKKFSLQYGFSIIPVSLDSKGIKEFPYPKSDYSIGKKLNVDVVPALFLVNPDKNIVSTVGYGYSDWTKLTAKVLFAGKQIEGEGRLKQGLYK